MAECKIILGKASVRVLRQMLIVPPSWLSVFQGAVIKPEKMVESRKAF